MDDDKHIEWKESWRDEHLKSICGFANAIAKFREMAVKKKRLNPEVLKEKDEDLIEKLQLKEDGKLKRAVILLFYPNPEDYFTGAYIKVGYFKNNADILYHDVIRGDLFTQVDKTVDLLLTKYLKAFIFELQLSECFKNFKKKVISNALVRIKVDIGK